MADDETTIKLLIEAEDRSRETFEAAKKRAEDLAKLEIDLANKVRDAQEKQANGQYKLNISAKEFFDLKKQEMNVHAQLQQAQMAQYAALQNLVAAHQKLTAAVTAHGNAATRAFGSAGQALLTYGKHFLAVSAIIETGRRALVTFAEYERGMNRIALESGKTSKELNDLGHTFTALSGMTGRHMSDLQASFLKMKEQTTGPFQDVVHLFERVTTAAHVAGVQSETVAKIAATAMADLKIPITEMGDYLDTLVKTVPASMMETWGHVGPHLTQVLKDIGFTGKENAELLQAGFAGAARALGSAERAGQGVSKVMTMAGDISTRLGTLMVPQIQRIQQAGGDASDVMIEAYERMRALGVDDPNLVKRSLAQRMFGVTQTDIDALKEAVEQTRILKEVAHEAGTDVNTVQKALGLLGKDSKTSLDTITASFNNMLESLGDILVMSGLPNALSEFLKSTARDIEMIVKLWKWVEEHVPGMGSKGYSEPGAEPGAPTKPTAQGQMFGGVGQFFGQSGQMKWDLLMRMFGIGGMVPGGGGEPQGPVLPPAVRQKLEDDAKAAAEARQKKEEEIKEKYEQRRLLIEQRRQQRKPAYATGGSFEVGGQGGVDSQDVSFRATPGERVDVTTPLQESLQQQQDKADIAMREHFSRFHQTAFTKTTPASWWPSGGVREPGAAGGGGGRSPLSGGGHPSSGASTRGPSSGGGQDGSTGTTEAPGTGSTPLKTPTNLDVTSPQGPAQDIQTAIERGYLKPPDAGGTATGGGSPYLANQRAALFKELDANPALKTTVARLIATENHSTAPGARAAILERLVNEAVRTGKTVEQMVGKSGTSWYGPIKNNNLRNLSDEEMKVSLREMETVRGGSNLIDFRTEQGMWNDKHREHPWTKKVGVEKSRLKNILGEYFSDADQEAQNWANKQREAMKTYDAAHPADGKPAGATGAPTVGTASSVKSAVYAGQSFDAQGNVVDAPAGGSVDLPTSKTAVWAPSVEKDPNYPNVTELQPKVAKDRRQGLDPRLKSALDVAAGENGLKVVVTSGGQHKHGEGGTRTGSLRHDHGGAADFDLVDPKTGKTLERNDPRRLAFLQRAASLGAGGAGTGYMSDKRKIHMGITGASSRVGEGLGAYAGNDAERAAINKGVEEWKKDPTKLARIMKERRELAQKKAQEQQAANKPATAPTNTKSETSKPADGRAAGKSAAAVAAHNTQIAAADTGDKAAGKSSAAVAAHTAANSPVADKPGGIGSRQWGGGVRAGRPYMVGESGPELFTPAGPGQITPGGFDIGGMAAQYQQFAEMMRTPIRPQIEMPRAGPIMRRASRRIEQQREIDVSRMSRHAAHSDIGFT